MSVDRTESLAAAVRQAYTERRPLRIVGGDTQRDYGRRVDAQAFVVAEHRGVVQYDPTELVVTVRTGTPLMELEALLAEHKQMLGFEPPIFGAGGTIGGAVAAGGAGPRRPFTGSVRDFVLGVKLLDGRGEVLRFGGVVFKNVAGFDAFRLMAGSLGCLGVLLEVSLRLLPRPECERALTLTLDRTAAQRHAIELMRRPAALSGLCIDGERLHVRFSGSQVAVDETVATTGGEPESLEFWSQLRHRRHAFFAGAGPLWRISVPATAAHLALDGRWLWDWAGAQRWLISPEPAEKIRAAAAAAGGHATLFRGAQEGDEVFTPLPRALFELHRRIKAAFDPTGILNPGRMYAGL
jgi:glycolate oxidase FAD binding subunit